MWKLLNNLINNNIKLKDGTMHISYPLDTQRIANQGWSTTSLSCDRNFMSYIQSFPNPGVQNNNFVKDLENMENFIGYIVESSIEKNLNSINYNLDDISDTENYNILINLKLMLKKYLYENQKLLSFNIVFYQNLIKILLQIITIKKQLMKI